MMGARNTPALVVDSEKRILSIDGVEVSFELLRVLVVEPNPSIYFRFQRFGESMIVSTYYHRGGPPPEPDLILKGTEECAITKCS
jgi:hypothetical protein